MIKWFKRQWKQYLCDHPESRRILTPGWQVCAKCGKQWPGPDVPPGVWKPSEVKVRRVIGKKEDGL
jgi:hypothetical protein